jgi:hypothetical protein
VEAADVALAFEVPVEAAGAAFCGPGDIVASPEVGFIGRGVGWTFGTESEEKAFDPSGAGSFEPPFDGEGCAPVLVSFASSLLNSRLNLESFLSSSDI